jgi:hypothetical protein
MDINYYIGTTISQLMDSIARFSPLVPTTKNHRWLIQSRVEKCMQFERKWLKSQTKQRSVLFSVSLHKCGCEF